MSFGAALDVYLNGETIVFADGLEPEITMLKLNSLENINYLNLSGSNITSMKLTQAT